MAINSPRSAASLAARAGASPRGTARSTRAFGTDPSGWMAGPARNLPRGVRQRRLPRREVDLRRYGNSARQAVHVKHGFVPDRVGGCPRAGDDTELQPSPGRAAQRKATRDTQPLANVWSSGHVRENGSAITARVPTALPTVYQSAQARSGELLRQPLHIAYPCLPAGRARSHPFVAKFHVKPCFRPGAGRAHHRESSPSSPYMLCETQTILGEPPAQTLTGVEPDPPTCFT
jgi:hypothetical protein